MKRTRSLVGSILGTIIHGIQSIANLYSLYAMFILFSLVNDISASTPENAVAKIIYTMLFFVALIIELISITALILSCVSFSYIRKPHEIFAKKKGVTVALVVFNFILIALFAISFLGAISSINIVLSVVSIVILLTANILYLVDLSKEKHIVAQAQPQETENVPAVEKEEPTQKAE